ASRPAPYFWARDKPRGRAYVKPRSMFGAPRYASEARGFEPEVGGEQPPEGRSVVGVEPEALLPQRADRGDVSLVATGDDAIGAAVREQPIHHRARRLGGVALSAAAAGDGVAQLKFAR